MDRPILHRHAKPRNSQKSGALPVSEGTVKVKGFAFTASVNVKPNNEIN
jgi:hypothetical protein